MKLKNMSIRLKITLWFSLALAIVVTITYVVILSASDQVLQKTIRDSLIETVENNVDEVEYLSDIDENNDIDYYASYAGGYLEIDDDFLDEVNEVYTSLCDENGTFIYGENPIARYTSDIAFLDSEVQEITVDGTLYYIYDKELTLSGLEGLWLRGIVSEEQGDLQLSSISRASLIILPSILLLAIIGGYFISKRTLAPIKQISDAANEIEHGDDLKKRIDIGEGKDELHELANQFNEMFERLDDSFTTQQQFVSDASHELRTPVAVIKSQCELSLEKDYDTAEYKKALLTIQRQSKKMEKLINDMLDFSRLELQTERYPTDDINLSELVENVCFDMALIKEKGIALSVDAKKDVHFVGNRELLTRLLTNLINNAYRYGKENGHIHVTLSAEEHALLLSVADDGIGISENELQNIFKRFYQVDSSRSNAGSGLGLAMVREIAHFHGGEVSVESTLGEGSVFTLKLRY